MSHVALKFLFLFGILKKVSAHLLYMTERLIISISILCKTDTIATSIFYFKKAFIPINYTSNHYGLIRDNTRDYPNVRIKFLLFLVYPKASVKKRTALIFLKLLH